MAKQEKLILIGGGGHSKACIDVIEQEKKFKVAGIIDMKERIGQQILGYPIVGADADLDRFIRKGYKFLITLGQIGNAEKRMALFHKLRSRQASLAVVISPLAYVSKHAEVMEGTIVMHGAIINAGVHVGENCIINTKALIEHDAHVGDHCHISTGAIVNGGVVIGDGSFIGSGSVFKQSAVLGKNSFVKANSIVK